MSDTSVSDTSTSAGSESPDTSPLRIALGFFIVPLLLVLAAVGIFLLFGLSAHETKAPSEYLAEIAGSGINEPWQAAFHLSQQLRFEEGSRGDEGLARRIVDTLGESQDSPRVRRYLVLALGRIGHAAAIPALVEHTRDRDEEVRIYSVWALGNIGDPVAAAAVARRLQDDSTDVRTIAAYVLGIFEDPGSREPLAVALADPAPAVRWNAAVALAKLGDRRGLDVLTRMVDRGHLDRVADLRPEQRRQAMLAAVGALNHLGGDRAVDALEALRADPDLRVRDAALQALSRLRPDGPSES